MTTPHFNPNRRRELEKLLKIVYDRRHDLEQDVEMNVGDLKHSASQILREKLLPRLRSLEQEYAEELIAAVSESKLSALDGDASALVARLSELSTQIANTAPRDAAPELWRSLETMRTALSREDRSAPAKLKITLPLIPAICAYEMEIEPAKMMKEIWNTAKELFRKLADDPRDPR
jgi:hypothetical protein